MADFNFIGWNTASLLCESKLCELFQHALSLEALKFAEVLDHIVSGVAVLGSDLVLDEVRQRASRVHAKDGGNPTSTLGCLDFVVGDRRVAQHIFTLQGDILGFLLNCTHAL